MSRWTVERLGRRGDGVAVRAGERALATDLAAGLCRTLIEGGVDRLHFYTLNRPDLVADVCAAIGVRAPDGAEQAVA